MKHLLRIRESNGFPIVSRIARLCLVLCINIGPWLIKWVELDFNNFASKSTTTAIASIASNLMLSASGTFPCFESFLSKLGAPRLLSFEAIVIFAALAFVAKVLPYAFELLALLQGAAASAEAAVLETLPPDGRENDGLAERLFSSSCNGVSFSGISTYQWHNFKCSKLHASTSALGCMHFFLSRLHQWKILGISPM